jgi:5-methylcytosine-specific restriction protein A
VKPRQQPLRRNTTLRANTSLPRTGELKRGPVKSRKPETWSPKQRKDRDLVRARSGGLCELCGAAAGTNIHHRRPRKMGGSRRPDTNLPQNLLHLCGSATEGCHGLIEGNRGHAYSNGWLVADRQDPADIPCLHRGQYVWLRSDGTYISALGETA